MSHELRLEKYCHRLDLEFIVRQVAFIVHHISWSRWGLAGGGKKQTKKPKKKTHHHPPSTAEPALKRKHQGSGLLPVPDPSCSSPGWSWAGTPWYGSHTCWNVSLAASRWGVCLQFSLAAEDCTEGRLRSSWLRFCLEFCRASLIVLLSVDLQVLASLVYLACRLHCWCFCVCWGPIVLRAAGSSLSYNILFQSEGPTRYRHIQARALLTSCMPVPSHILNLS